MSSNKKGIIYYLLITFGLAWAIWGIPLLAGASVRSSLFGTLLTIGAFAPAEASAFVRAWVSRDGFKNIGLSINPKKDWRYYLFALLLPVGVSAVVVLLAVLAGLGRPDLSLKVFFERVVLPGDEIPAPGLNIWVSMVLQLIGLSVVQAPFSFGEEFGWRGYFQTRAFSGRPVLAAIATGLIWGVWYLPLNLAGYSFPGQPLLGSAIFPVSAVLLSFIYGWLFLKTGSIWVSCVAHAATESVGVSLMLILFGETSADLLFTGYYGILGWLPLGAVCAWIILTGRQKREEAGIVSEEKKEATPAV
jgi:membrane protease YdiL (CAAX protease family)